jgi:hypothetical protein
MPSDDEMIFSPIDHLCRYCSHRLEAADVDPAWVRCVNPACQAETYAGARDVCYSGGLDDDAPIHFQCVRNRRRNDACPDEIIVVERPPSASRAPTAR